MRLMKGLVDKTEVLEKLNELPFITCGSAGDERPDTR